MSGDGFNMEKDERAADEVSQYEKMQNTEDLAYLLKSIQFRRWLGRKITELGIDRSVAHPNSSEMSRREGRRMVAVELKQEVLMISREAWTDIDRLNNPTEAEYRQKLSLAKKG